MNDVRGEEGQSIRTFVSSVNNVGLDRVPSSQLLDYASNFVSYINKLNGVTLNKRSSTVSDAQRLKVLRYMVHYYIFGPSVIGNEINMVESLRSEDENRHFCKQQLKVKGLSAEQLGVAQRYLPITAVTTASVTSSDHHSLLMQQQEAIQSVNEPYGVPIDILSCLSWCTVPMDMLHCVYMCAKQIHLIAKAQCELRKKDFTFGADEFSPIGLRCLQSQSHLYPYQFGQVYGRYQNPTSKHS